MEFSIAMLSIVIATSLFGIHTVLVRIARALEKS